MYDGECPFCKNYVNFLRLRDAFGDIKLINARERTKEREMVDDQKLNLDNGMVIHFKNKYYHGDDAMHIISTLTEDQGLKNRFTKWVFSSPSRAKFIYPLLRSGRNAALFVLRRKKIHEP